MGQDANQAIAAWPSEELNRCPFPFYGALRREGPIVRDPVRGDYLVSRHDEIAYVVRHPELFSVDLDGETAAQAEAAGCPAGRVPPGQIVTTTEMTMTDAPEHDVKRAVARRMIARERLASYEPLIQELVHERIDTFVHRGEVEFCSELANPLAFHMICRILGIPKEEVEIYWSRGQPGTGHGFRFLSEEQQAELLARPDPESYMREQVLRRYEHPGGDDFLSEFVAAHVERADGELQLDYLTTESELLLRAGNETTARLLASTMRLLLENPAELDRVVADRSLAKAAIEETLRLEAPTQWVTRRCTQDTDVGGVRIPAGALVVVLYASGNRDEEKWGDDVDAFRLDRTDVVKHQLAFGTGAHLCLGAPIARLEARIALEIILERLRNIRFAPGHGEVENIDHIQKRAPKALYLEFDPA